MSQCHRSRRVQSRCGNSARSTRLICGRVTWGIFFPPLLLKSQQEQTGQEGKQGGADVIINTVDKNSKYYVPNLKAKIAELTGGTTDGQAAPPRGPHDVGRRS